MFSGNPFSIFASSPSPSTQEIQTHQTVSKQSPSSSVSTSNQEHMPQEENPNGESTIEETPNQENPIEETPVDKALFLFPESKSEEEDEAIFLATVLNYKRDIGTLPSSSELIQNHPLIDYINANAYNLKRGESINEAVLTSKFLKLHNNYNSNFKKLFEEKGESPGDEIFSSDLEQVIFALSIRIWNEKYDDETKVVSENDDRFLFPRSTCEEDDDIATLINLNIYNLYDESFLPSFVDHPGQQHSLLDFINSKREGGCIDEARLRDKVLELQIKYKNVVEEKGPNPEHQDFSTCIEHTIFLLSRRAWGKYQEFDVHPEADFESETGCLIRNLYEWRS